MSDRTLPIHFDTSYAWMRVLIRKSHWLDDAEFQSLPAFPPVLFSQKKKSKPGIVLGNSQPNPPPPSQPPAATFKR